MSPLAQALLAELTPDDLDALAEMLAPRIAVRLQQPVQDGWLTTKQAAEHLGMTATALHKLTAGRAIPFEQDGPGCRCWFKRADLDGWRCGQR